MSDPDKPDQDESSQVEELRKEAYEDPAGTTVVGAQAFKDLVLPVGRIISLEIIEGPRKGLEHNFQKGNLVIGRAQEADLVIDDDKISRKHCIIEAFARDLVFISDLASTNGTTLNGMRIRSTKLKDGDRIQVGNSVLIFHLKDENS